MKSIVQILVILLVDVELVLNYVCNLQKVIMCVSLIIRLKLLMQHTIKLLIQTMSHIVAGALIQAGGGI